MALKTFIWSPKNGPTADIQYRTRSAQYNDGYEQIVGDGINNEVQSWPLTFIGKVTDMRPILNFLREHGEGHAFRWENPFGELGLYRSTQLKVSALDFARMSIAVTFVTAYRADS